MISNWAEDKAITALHDYVLPYVMQAGLTTEQFLRMCREELAQFLEEQARNVRKTEITKVSK